MPQSGLRGSYRLEKWTIDHQVTRTSPGAYALGRTRNDVFEISYVGRSDDDVRGRLLQWIGSYAEFKYEYYPSAKAAFEKECHLWHDFGGDLNKLDNERHPARPAGTTWQCPRCDACRSVTW